MTWGEPPGAVRVWLVLGASLGVVGDVVLMRDGERSFMVGLVSFAVGHVAYVVAATQIEVDVVAALPGLLASIGLIGYRFVPGAVRGAAAVGGTVVAGAVVGYAIVIGAMTTTAWATGSLVAGVGAVLFAFSDWVIGHERFIGPFPGGRLSVMIPYHVGQALLLIGLAGR